MSTTEKLKQEIKKHLTKCDQNGYPNICKTVQTRAGYARIEAQIIEIAIRDNVGILGAMNIIESDLL